MSVPRSINEYSCLTFDCYGTLVDWEEGIYRALLPLARQLPASHPLHGNRPETLKAFTRLEEEMQRARPEALYSSVLADAYGRLAAQVGVAASEADKAKFGASVGDWPVFPDTVEALGRLHEHFKLVILSNVDRESFKRTLAKQLAGIDFDAIYTAQDIGSYKPDQRNFEYLIVRCKKDLGVEKGAIIHTAQSLSHDHVPAKQVGLASAWIERGVEIASVMGGALDEHRDEVDFSWHYQSMGEMADALDAIKAKAA